MFILPKKQISLIVFLIIFILALPGQVKTADNSFTLIPACWEAGNCTVCNLLNVIIKAGILLLAVIGAIALLYIIFGGLTIMMAAGVQEQVNKGKRTLVNATIGLFIVLFSFASAQLIVSLVTGEWKWQTQLVCEEIPPVPPLPPTHQPPAQCYGNPGSGVKKTPCNEDTTHTPKVCCDCGNTPETQGYVCAEINTQEEWEKWSKIFTNRCTKWHCGTNTWNLCCEQCAIDYIKKNQSATPPLSLKPCDPP